MIMRFFLKILNLDVQIVQITKKYAIKIHLQGHSFLPAKEYNNIDAV